MSGCFGDIAAFTPAPMIWRMRVSILDRYLFREMLYAWGAVTAVLLAIMLSHSLLRVLIKAGSGALDVDSILPLLAATSINLLVTIVPLGVYLGIIIGLGRLYQDSEMVVLSACGQGVRQLYRPVVALGMLGAIISFVLTVYASPWAEGWEGQIKRLSRADSPAKIAQAGKFVESQSGELVFFSESITENRSLEKVFIRQVTESGNEIIEVAQRAYHQASDDTGDNFLVLVDGERTLFKGDGSGIRVTRFGEHGVRIPRSAGSAPATVVEYGWLATRRLLHAGDAPSVAEYHWRVGVPFAAIVLAILALPMANSTPRQGRYGKLAIAIVVYIFYTNLLVLTRKWIAAGELPDWLGLWWVHALMMTVAIAMLVWLRQVRLPWGSPA